MIRKKNVNLTLIVAVIIAILTLSGIAAIDRHHVKTEAFIKKYMVNPNGTLATYLVDTKQGKTDIAVDRDALSESLGLWMRYAIEKRDRTLFDESYKVLTYYFLTKDGYLYWKLDSNGRPSAPVNALVDDLRIVEALYDADQVWSNTNWRQTANVIGRSLLRQKTADGLLPDFVDFKLGRMPEDITLSYLNSRALSKLQAAGLLDHTVYNHLVTLTRSIPNDGVFYPKVYTADRQYRFDETVNMIDQLYIALARLQAGVQSHELLAFLKAEIQTKGILYGTYHRNTRLSKEGYESPAVYALSILYLLEVNDIEYAITLYQRMVKLRLEQGDYAGGYIVNGQTHIFDNLYPQLAELQLYHRAPYRMILP